MLAILGSLVLIQLKDFHLGSRDHGADAKSPPRAYYRQRILRDKKERQYVVVIKGYLKNWFRRESDKEMIPAVICYYSQYSFSDFL
jgi:hypothetical protein